MTAIYLGMPKRSPANQMARKPLDILRYPKGGRWSKLKWDMRCGNRQLFNFFIRGVIFRWAKARVGRARSARHARPRKALSCTPRPLRALLLRKTQKIALFHGCVWVSRRSTRVCYILRYNVSLENIVYLLNPETAITKWFLKQLCVRNEAYS